MIKLIVLVALALFIFMTAAYVVGLLRKRLDTVDIAWGPAFMVAAWISAIAHPSTRAFVIAGLVTVWGVRLSVHIGRRALFSKDDRRYKELTTKWQGNIWLRAYYSIFLVQAALVLIISTPVMVAAERAAVDGLGWLSVVGGAVWLIGFIFESVGDYQLSTFLKQPNRGPVMKSGLWKYSRHPNYFGELVEWWGIGIIALQVSFGWVGLIGPAVLTYLILFISGIPPIENHRKNKPEYRDYMKQTSMLIPLPPRS